MNIYVIYSGESNLYSNDHDYNIISVHATAAEAIKTWKEIKAKNAVFITNPHFFTVRKITL